MPRKIIRIIVFALLVSSCSNKLIHGNKDIIYHIPTVNNNVCKALRGKVILYAIFVDSKSTGVWTGYDIHSTLDSTRKAIQWIQNEAAKNNIGLNITLAYHESDKTIPISANLPKGSIAETLLSAFGARTMDRWADKIAKEALRSFPPDKSISTKTKIIPKNRDKLLARLRDIHQTDNIALLYFVNNYYKNDVSFVLHSADGESPEYGLISYKQPGVIAHEFLHLFGTLDLYLSPFDHIKRMKKKKEFAMREFPDEIMAFPYRRIHTLTLSPFSKYLIGWNVALEDRYKNMLIGKKIKVAKY